MSFLKRKNTIYKTYLERTRKKEKKRKNEGREGGEGIKSLTKRKDKEKIKQNNN